MESSKEFVENNKHIYDYAAELRKSGNDADANILYYLLNAITDRCDIIDEQTAKLKKTWSNKSV
jgi:hypothetical protein